LFPTAASGAYEVKLFKNGSEYTYNVMFPSSAASVTAHLETIVQASVSDYFEAYVYQNTGSSKSITTQFISSGEFSCAYLGA
jgi:hypothetical protein